MARVDDVVFNYLHLPRNAVQNECIKGALEDAVRYGFEQGESYGKYARYVGEVNEEIAREVFQKIEPKTKKIQKVVRTEKGYKPTELDSYLNDGWHVAHITPMADGRLEYIIETEKLEKSEAEKKPEENHGF